MTDDYALARIAALRGRLLDEAALAQLRGATNPAGFLRILERSEDWGPLVRLVAPLATDPLAAAEAAVERHRSLRIGRLVRWFEPPTRSLVEALVLPLDRERLVALLRLRRAGADPETTGASVAPGALLGPDELRELARAGSLGEVVLRLSVVGLVPTERLPELLRSLREAADPAGWATFEAALAEAVEAARTARATGRSADARFVQELLRQEQADRRAVALELEASGPTAAVRLERALVLARLGRLARAARRDPLSLRPVAGYIAAVELQALRLRAILARLRSGWRGEILQLGSVGSRSGGAGEVTVGPRAAAREAAG